jgi:hypothetical protein
VDRGFAVGRGARRRGMPQAAVTEDLLDHVAPGAAR